MKKILLFALMLTMGLTAKADCQDGPYGLQINGSKVVDAPKYGDPDYQGRVQYKASCVDLKVGDVVKLINQSCDATWMVDLDEYSAPDCFDGGKEAGKLTCKVAGKYDFYIKLSMEVGDLLYVGPGEDCGDPDPGYKGSAPAKCPDVLLQGFYWNSYQNVAAGSATEVYGRTKWVDWLNKTVEDGVTTRAEEAGDWFDLIWLPPMSKSTGGLGYHPSNYSNLDSDLGTKKNIVKLIETFHQHGARVVADIVINHSDGEYGWCKFGTFDFGEYGKFTPDGTYICSTDEVNYAAEAPQCHGWAVGNVDDGYGAEANYASSRDWDHKSPAVRTMLKAYLKWMKNVVKVDGFRYDYCKGYNNSHVNDYNKAAEIYFSVMEMWDGNVNTLMYHLNEAGYNTLTFDFATKYTAFNNGIASNNYGALQGAGLPGAGKSRYAVTFLDSHDSFLRDGNEFCGEGNSMTVCYDKIMQCYAYLLSMPGVPLVFYPHWVTFKEPLKALINARYKTGVHSESAVTEESAGSDFYKATIIGTNGQIRLLVGPGSGYNTTPSGYTLASKGINYGVYYKSDGTRGDKNTERHNPRQGVKETKVEEMPTGVKFMQDGKLYIRCGEQVFDIMGRLVK